MFIKGQPLPKVTNMDASSAGAQKHILKQSADTCTVWKKDPTGKLITNLSISVSQGRAVGEDSHLPALNGSPHSIESKYAATQYNALPM